MDVFSPTLPASPLDHWTLIIGFFMPTLIAVINQSRWSTRWKTLIAFVACFMAATIQLGLKGQLDPANLVVSGLSITALSITFFKGIWKPSGVANALEKATDPRPVNPKEEDDLPQ